MTEREDVLEYVRRSLKEGHTHESVRSALVSAGWHVHDVEEALARAAHVGPGKSKGDGGGMGMLSRFRTVMTRPCYFFENVKGEEGYSEAFKYFTVLLFIIAIPQIIAAVFMFQYAGAHADTSEPLTAFTVGLLPIILVTIVVGFFISQLLYIFIRAGLIHYIFARPLGAKGEFIQTFKAYVYGFQSPFVVQSLLLSVSTVYLYAAATIPVEELSALVESLLTITPLLILPWNVYLMTRGMEKLHDVSITKAFVMVLIPVLISIALAFLLSYITSI